MMHVPNEDEEIDKKIDVAEWITKNFDKLSRKQLKRYNEITSHVCFNIKDLPKYKPKFVAIGYDPND